MNLVSKIPFSKENRVRIPEVRITDPNTVKVDGSEFQVHPRSLQARVLEYFFSCPNGLLKRGELLDLLYEDELEDALSTIRYEGSRWCSGHKVMSRLRKGLSQKFLNRVPAGTEWLPFSNILDGWILFKLPGYGSDGGWHP
jgi:hypothetical protein